MANIRSQIKRNRTNERRRQRNRAVKSELRTRVKTALTTAGDEGTGDEALRLALKKIDKAASKGVIHKNAAARRKSRLQKQINKAAAAG
jgi:small subunit ribosomal protein S20